MNLRRIGNRYLSLVLLGLGVAGSPMHGAAQQSALTFQPATMTTLAGTGASGFSGDGGSALSATVSSGMKNIVADAAGDVFFFDTTDFSIRVVYEGGSTAAQLITAENPAVTAPVIGNIYIIAGIENSSGTPGSNVLGAAAKLGTSNGGALGIDAAGDIYFSGTSYGIWVIYAGGNGTAATNLIALETVYTSPKLGYIYKVAGGVANGSGGDGTLATSSSNLHGIDDVKIDAQGNMYIADQGNNVIRKVSASNGFISTLAGTAGTTGNSVSGSPASGSLLNAPYAVAVDASSNVYISDKNNNLIRMIYAGGAAAAALITLENPTVATPIAGNLYTIAGGGSGLYPYRVLATSAKLNGVTGMTLDPAGNLYLAVNGYNLIAEINATTGVLSEIVGTSNTAGTPTGNNGDGTTSGLLNAPRGVAVDAAGRIDITDDNDYRVRQVGPQTVVVFPGQATGTTSAPQTVMLNNIGDVSLSFTAGTPTFGGPNGAYFSVNTASPSNTCDFNSPLASGASCTVALVYSPLASGASSATLSFATNGVLSPQIIQLQASSLPGTTTTLQSSASSVIKGATVNLTATVAGSADPGGSVAFSSNGTLLGTAPLNGSKVATYPFITTATGLFSITAVYSGDSSNATSSSTAVTVNVTGATPSTTVASATPTTVNQGQSVMFSATVSGSGATPTGLVTFSSGTALLGSGALNGSGVATLSSTTVPVGNNSVVASYPGDATYAASVSTAFPVQVNGTPTLNLTTSTTAVNAGVPVTLTTTVSGSGVTPTGSVTFYVGGTTSLGTVVVANGVATLITSALPNGTPDVVTSSYSGDGNYSPGTSAAVSITVTGRAFVHPGGLHTIADLNRMKSMVAAGAHPWIDDWNVLLTDPQAAANYGSHATTNMGSSRQNADLDAHAAYLNAIRFYISGDTSFADEAVSLLNSWSAKVNQVPTGTDIPGLIAIPIQDFNLAAEIMRSLPFSSATNPNGWSAANIAAFQAMNTNYLYPVVNDFLTNHNGACISNYWANWDAANLGALIAMGVFNDNTAWFNQGINYYENGAGEGAIAHAVPYLYPSAGIGQWEESGRDQEHAQLGVGLLGYAAMTAWNQGVDLFGYSNNRLLAGAEYDAQYNQNLSVPYTTFNNCDNVQQYWVSTNGRDRLDDRPVYELIYNHYNVLQGLSTPNVQAMANLERPEHGSTDHFGYGTLTFTLKASASPYPPAPVPAAPTGVTATASMSQIFLTWDTTSAANGYNVLRAGSSNGTYTRIANLTETTMPAYTDTSVTNGVAYYYEVQAINQSGVSANSTYATASAVAPGALPPGWLDSDVGTVQTAGSAQYVTASNNTFQVTGQGAGIGGTSDSFNYAYRQVTGDFTLTARLVNETGTLTQGNLGSGLMMRNSLQPGDMTIALVLGATGNRIGRAGTRATAGGSMSYTTGNQYTITPTWFQLQRRGNVFTALQSSDGVTWFTVSTSTIAMASTYYVGFAACSGDSSSYTTETSSFDNVGPSLQGQQAISFAPATPVTYGVAPITLTATGGGSSKPVTFTLVSGPATLSGRTLTVLGAGTIVIAADQAGDGNYASAPTVQGTIVVNPAVLNVAVSGSPGRIFGLPNPAFSYTIGPFVGTDTQTSATTGAPVLTTAAVPKSAAGSYTIVTAMGTLSATNYTFNLVNGTLNVSGNAAQAIVFSRLANFTHGTSVPLIAFATSGLPITFSVTGPASVNNSTGILTVTGTGSVTVTAAQAGDANFAAATSVAQTFMAQ